MPTKTLPVITNWTLDRNRGALLLASAFLIVIAILTIGNLEIRLADTHADNGAVFYSYLFGHPAEFTNDPFGLPGRHWLWGSICFWAPVLLDNYLGIDPRFLSYLFFTLQIILMGLAVFLLTLEVSASWLVALTSTASALIVQPWSWNLAAYPMPLAIPLYTTLAIALAALTGTAFLKRQWRLAWLLAICTALVHPIIACYLLPMLAIWGWLARAEWRSWLSTRTLAKLGVLVALCGIPFVINLGITESLLSPQETWVTISKHMHSVPWGNYPPVFNDLSLKTLGFVLVMACCWRMLLVLPQNQRRFLLAVGLGTVLLSCTQLVGIWLKIGPLALGIGLRSFSIFVLLAWPFVFTTLSSREVLGRFFGAFALLLLTFVWIQMQGGVPILSLLLLAVVLFWPDGRRTPSALAVIAVLALLPLLLLGLGSGSWVFVEAHRPITTGYYSAALLIAVIGASLLMIPRAIEPVRHLAALFVIFVAVKGAYADGAETRQPRAIDLYNAEVWARDHTAPGTAFMTLTNWRTISQRPSADLLPNLTEEVYTPFKYIRARDEFLLRLYGMGDSWREMGILAIITHAMNRYLALKEPDFVTLAEQFKAPFLVRSTLDPVLSFPVAYQNGSYVIYCVRPKKAEGKGPTL
jgi:hypothetical protein